MTRLMQATGVVIAFVLATTMGWLGVAAQESTPDASPEVGGAPSPRDETLLTLIDAQSQEIGTVVLVEMPDDGQLSIQVNAQLEPGAHGLHIHETGICDPNADEPFSSAGGHYNPAGTSHGGPPPDAGEDVPAAQATPGAGERHAGDLGNIEAGDDGVAILSLMTAELTLSELADEDGSAIVIHANADDLQTDPSGNSGSRVACGVIFPPQADDGQATPGATVATPEA